jgi:hypothetical protein
MEPFIKLGQCSLQPVGEPQGGNREPADRSTGFPGIVDLSTDDSFLTKTCQSPKLFLGIKQQS